MRELGFREREAKPPVRADTPQWPGPEHGYGCCRATIYSTVFPEHLRWDSISSEHQGQNGEPNRQELLPCLAKLSMTTQPSNSNSGFTLKSNANIYSHKTCAQLFTEALFTVVEKWGRPERPPRDGRTKRGPSCSGTELGHKKDETLTRAPMGTSLVNVLSEGARHERPHIV